MIPIPIEAYVRGEELAAGGFAGDAGRVLNHAGLYYLRFWTFSQKSLSRSHWSL